MWEGSAVFVVVPAFNEAPRIVRTLREIPRWVDRIIVVDDASADATRAEAVRYAEEDSRVVVCVHPQNRGVGAAIRRGYIEAFAWPGYDNPRDAAVVMAGDGQMDPADLPALLEPIVRDRAGYVKGDRFRHPDVQHRMPKGRYLGGRVFSALTSLAIGHPVSDSQCGYTALTRATAGALDLEGLWPGFGYPNDLLSQLVLRRVPIAEVPVFPRYGDEESKLRLRHLPRIGMVVARAFRRRIAAK